MIRGVRKRVQKAPRCQPTVVPQRWSARLGGVGGIRVRLLAENTAANSALSDAFASVIVTVFTYRDELLDPDPECRQFSRKYSRVAPGVSTLAKPTGGQLVWRY